MSFTACSGCGFPKKTTRLINKVAALIWISFFSLTKLSVKMHQINIQLMFFFLSVDNCQEGTLCFWIMKCPDCQFPLGRAKRAATPRSLLFRGLGLLLLLLIVEGRSSRDLGFGLESYQIRSLFFFFLGSWFFRLVLKAFLRNIMDICIRILVLFLLFSLHLQISILTNLW